MPAQRCTSQFFLHLIIEDDKDLMRKDSSYTCQKALLFAERQDGRFSL